MWAKVLAAVLIYFMGNFIPALNSKRSTSIFKTADTLKWFKGDTIRFGGVLYRVKHLSDSTQVLFNADGSIDTIRLSGFNN